MSLYLLLCVCGFAFNLTDGSLSLSVLGDCDGYGMGDGRWYADMWSEEPKNWLPNQGNSTLPFAAVLLADGTQHKVQYAYQVLEHFTAEDGSRYGSKFLMLRQEKPLHQEGEEEQQQQKGQTQQESLRQGQQGQQGQEKKKGTEEEVARPDGSDQAASASAAAASAAAASASAAAVASALPAAFYLTSVAKDSR